jgi:hypothetical protein
MADWKPPAWASDPLGIGRAGGWLLGPNADAEKARAEMRARWESLVAWGVETRAPDAIPMLTRWRDHAARWEKSVGWGIGQDTDALRSLAVDLQVAENSAATRGYVPPVVAVDDRGVAHVSPGEPAPAGRLSPAVASPHPTEATRVNAAATAVDDAAREAQDRARAPVSDPYFAAKAAAVGVAGLATVAGTIAASGEARRIGVAALGAVATGGLALLLFLPSTPAPAPKKETKP